MCLSHQGDAGVLCEAFIMFITTVIGTVPLGDLWLHVDERGNISRHLKVEEGMSVSSSLSYYDGIERMLCLTPFHPLGHARA